MARQVKQWTRDQITKASFNQLSKAVARGAVTMDQIEKLYKTRRDTLMRYSREIAKSKEYGYAAFGQQRPEYETWRSLDLTKTQSDKLKAMVYVNEQWRSKTHTLKQREAQAKAAVKTLHERGITYVTPENYGLWVQFAMFIKTTKWVKWFYIYSDEAERAFTDALASAGDQQPSIDMITSMFVKYAQERGAEAYAPTGQ